MEKITNQNQMFDRSTLIKEAFEAKNSREMYGENPYTCYINIDSPMPDLALITASLLEHLQENPLEAYLWTKSWDKSIVALNPKESVGCHLLQRTDSRGKLFVPVMTTTPVETERLIKVLPEGELATIAVNEDARTIDAFLICYLHLVNELIWDLTMIEAKEGKLSAKTYKFAVEQVIEKGFVTAVMAEEEILMAKIENPNTSLRIYGSGVNKYVPQIMGAVIK